MCQIKTIIRPVERSADFDAEVNKLQTRGWRLKRREVLSIPGAPNEAFNVATFPVLYAELERRI